MARMYSAEFGAVAVSAVQDFFELLTTAAIMICIHGVEITQSSDVGDAAAEGLASLDELNLPVMMATTAPAPQQDGNDRKEKKARKKKKG